MNPVWPTPLEEQLLLAWFAPEETAGAALRRCAQEWNGAGEPAIGLLPLVYRRWPAAENRLVELGRRAYVTAWRQNRERMARLGDLASGFQRDGIRWMALKGAALALRHYADLGLRPMSDLDILIRREDLSRAVALLESAGYRAEEAATPDAILRQARVRHGWQFFGAPDWNIDLHWRPLSRCWSPEVTRLFWEKAETVRFAGRDILVPSPSDQLFHVCIHGLQWDWTRKVRWVADALGILREPVDWERVRQMAARSNMSFRLGKALAFLRERFHAPIPSDLAARLCLAAPKWECREYRLLLKPCPLGVLDSVAWHAYNFRRIRPFDDHWRHRPAALGFPQYLATFLDASGWRSFGRKIRSHAALRLERIAPARAR
jgi:hypothetical protein